MSHWYVIRTHAKAECKALSNVLRQGFDTVLFTDIKSAQAAYEALRRYLPDDRILAPELLRLTHKPSEAGE